MSKYLFPIGRLVWGSLYEPQTKDFDGNLLTIKTPGPDFGKPTQRYTFGVAVPKGAEKAWWETPWGAEIFKEASASFTRGEPQRPDFSWKITDGDSTLCKKGSDKPINTKAGHAGHWVLSFSSSYPPKLVTENGTKQLLEPNAVKTGYYVQVYGSITGNGNQNNPGVFLNHDTVNFSAYGEEIYTGVDPASVGFGGALPQGASATPAAGSFSPAPAMPAAPGVPAMPAMPAVPGVVAPAPMAAPAPVAPPVAVAPPPVVATAPAITMLPTSPHTYEVLKQSGWTDDQIVGQGYAVRNAAPASVGVIPVPSFLNGPQ